MDKKFIDIFNQIECEYDEIQELIGAVEVMSDHKLYRHYLKKNKMIEAIAVKYKKYKKICEDVENFKEIATSETDLKEIDNLKIESNNLFEELKIDYNDLDEKQEEKVQIEICSEDFEFKKELIELLEQYSIKNDFEILKDDEEKETTIIKLCGLNVYKSLSFFSGKIKKILFGKESTAGMVVLKLDDFNVEIKEEDLIIQTSKSSGAGGQHINKTESAVKIIHVPTGIYAECQDERSQTKNKEKAMQWLIEKITQNSEEKSKIQEKNQRNEIKNKLFASTPTLVFDFDANKVFVKSEKKEYKLKDILAGRLELIINDRQ